MTQVPIAARATLSHVQLGARWPPSQHAEKSSIKRHASLSTSLRLRIGSAFALTIPPLTPPTGRCDSLYRTAQTRLLDCVQAAKGYSKCRRRPGLRKELSNRAQFQSASLPDWKTRTRTTFLSRLHGQGCHLSYLGFSCAISCLYAVHL